MFNNTFKWKYWILPILLLSSLLMITNTSYACSVFCIDKGGFLVTGRSYDWSFEKGLIVVNKRGQLKTALRYWDESKNNLASWTSKYGSISFVQYGREIAFDGMNEAGLVVSELWLEETVYPSVDSRPSVSFDQYVQYILDNFKSVDEIIKVDSLVRIRPLSNNSSKIHFFTADSSGNCIVIEFLNGKMVFHTKETMPVKAITNNTYESSFNYINRGIPPDPNNNTSLERFYRLSTMIDDYKPEDGNAVAYTFKILDAVKQGSWTKFQTAFDIKNRIIYFKSQYDWQMKYFRFDAFDFSCQTVSKILDINTNHSGDVTDQFINYTWQVNEAMIKAGWEGLGHRNIYLPALQIISRYLETFECKGTKIDGEYRNELKQKIELNQNYPNPFNPETVISWQIAVGSYVTLKMYDVLGKEVATLVDEFRPSGTYNSQLSILNSQLCSGVYFYRLTSGNYSATRKLILIK